jgi:hypothetical protein
MGNQFDLVFAVGVFEGYHYMIKSFCGERNPHKIGTNRHFTMAAIDQYGELDLAGAAVVRNGIERGADGPAGEKNVIDEDDGGIIEWYIDLAALEFRVFAEMAEVIAVERDIEDAEVDFAIILGEERAEALGDFIATTADADDGEGLAGMASLDGLGEGFDGLGDVIGLVSDGHKREGRVG